MGRLPSVASLLALALAAACDRGTSAGTASRSEQVIATGSMPTAASTASSASPEAHPAPAAASRRTLCAGDGNARGRVVPKAAPQHIEADGAPRLAAGSPLAHGRWTWLNFWAAWCAPCKEEMPRLLAWQERLARAGTPVQVAFVSLDDDSRQLEQFLAQQPPAGVRASYWLNDGPGRTAWLSALKMKSAPELPEHALIDPAGHVRCFIEGAVEDADYAEIADLVARP
jgi:thiol-disulfide isomerase/thioredoxin